MFTSIGGRAVVVTGGTRGIGKGIARVFGKNGAHVLVTGRDGTAGQAALEELRATSEDVSWCRADVAVRADCERMAETAVERLGGIDVLCANAGVFPPRLLADMTDAELEDSLGTNLRGCVLSVQACLPALRRSAHGRVILTSSITGPITGQRGHTVYGATKAGQLGFLRSAAVELAPSGITVNAVLPGSVLTEGTAPYLDEDRIRAISARIPLGRFGTVEDVAYAVLFLATDEASYITGQTIVVDGGQVLPE